MRSDKDIRELIFNFHLYPKWREDVYAVKEAPSTTPFHAWTETNGAGKKTLFQMVAFKQNGAQTDIIIDIIGERGITLERLNFKITGHDENQSSTLSITDDRLISNRVSRVVKHLLSQGTNNIDSYFLSINNKFIGDALREKRRKATKTPETVSPKAIKPETTKPGPAAASSSPAPGSATTKKATSP